MARCNLTDFQFHLAIGEVYTLTKMIDEDRAKDQKRDDKGHFLPTAKEDAGRGNSYLNGSGNSRAKEIAKDIGKSEKTVRNAANFHKGYKEIEATNPDLAKKILNKDVEVTQKDVENIGKVFKEPPKSSKKEKEKPVNPKVEETKEKIKEELKKGVIRNELDFIDRGNHFKERKEIYETLYPKTKAGVAGAIAKYNKDHQCTKDDITKPDDGLAVPSFVENTKAKTGLSKTVIKEEIRIASNLDDHEKEIYETLYPETKAGISQALGMNKKLGHNVGPESGLTLPTFVKDPTKKNDIGLRSQTLASQYQHSPNIRRSRTPALRCHPLLKIPRRKPDWANALKCLHKKY